MTSTEEVVIFPSMDTLQESQTPITASATALTAGPDRAARRTILLYAGVVIVALTFTSPSVGLFVIPLSFILKNKLHLSASGLALFTLCAGIPAYFAFAFGVIRDRWSPLGLGDRGYFALFGGLSALLYIFFSFIPVGEDALLLNAFLGVVTYLFLWAAWNGLASTLGQRHAISGEISAVWNSGGTITTFVALILGGVLSGTLESLSTGGAVSTLFLLAAIFFAAIAALGAWRPAAVFGRSDGQTDERRDLLRDLVRLAKHRPIYPALAIWLFWNFSPGTQTVLQFHMTDHLHASDAQWGAYNAISNVTAVPTFVLFGWLSRRVSLKTLIWVGTLIGVWQMIPLLFASSAEEMVLAAIPVGLLGGIATASYMDLLIRSCPRGLEGAMMMTAWTMYALATNFGNVFGTEIYAARNGFFISVIATTIVYALILPTILLVPKRLIATADGSAPSL